MSRKLLSIILIPAVLLLVGYFALQVYLRTGNRKEEKELEQSFGAAAAQQAKVDSLGGKKVSPADLRPLFVERLKLLLKKSSNGLYDLSVGDLKVDVLASAISLQNVTVRPDAKALENGKASGQLPNEVFSVAFQSLVLEGVNLDDVLTSKTMDYKLIRLVNPVIEIDHQKAKERKTEGDFAQRFLKEMEKLSVGKLEVTGGRIVVHDRQKGTRKTLSNVEVAMSDILLNEETRKDKNRFLFAKEARLRFRDFRTKTKDGLYNFRIGDAVVNASQKRVVLKNLSFQSPLSQEAFVRKQKVAREMYGLFLPSLTVTGLDWWSVLNEEEVIAREAVTSGGKFSVYFDRGLPPKNKMGNFPNQLLLKLPVQVDIARLKIRNLGVSYEERNPLSQQSGTVYLDNASMDFTNVNNNSKTPVVVNGTALLMHKIPIRAMFRFDMSGAKSGRFSASIQSTTPYDGRLLNPIAVPLGMMKVEKAELKKLTATIKGNEHGAGGAVEVLYNDLKLSLLEKDKGKASLDKKDVTSFLANLVVLKKDNPKDGKAPRQEQAQFRRDPTGGFMMLVWKTVLVGVLKTIGAPEKLAYKKSK